LTCISLTLGTDHCACCRARTRRARKPDLAPGFWLPASGLVDFWPLSTHRLFLQTLALSGAHGPKRGEAI